MIYLCADDYYIAKAFIEKYKLKKDIKEHRFQVFKNLNIILIVSGHGRINPAIIVTYLFSTINPKENDVFLSLGYCLTQSHYQERREIVFLCNHIIDGDTGKQYYPDIILKHSFIEKSIVSSSLNSNYGNDIKNLYDMETAGIFMASSLFMELHQIFFLKINKVDKDPTGLSKNQKDSIFNWIDTIKSPFPSYNSILSDKIEKEIRIISSNMKWTETMERQFKQYIIYKKVNNKSISQYIKKYLDINCNTKDEGKKFFAELKKEFI